MIREWHGNEYRGDYRGTGDKVSGIKITQSTGLLMRTDLIQVLLMAINCSCVLIIVKLFVLVSWRYSLRLMCEAAFKTTCLPVWCFFIRCVSVASVLYMCVCMSWCCCRLIHVLYIVYKLCCWHRVSRTAVPDRGYAYPLGARKARGTRGYDFRTDFYAFTIWSPVKSIVNKSCFSGAPPKNFWGTQQIVGSISLALKRAIWWL